MANWPADFSEKFLTIHPQNMIILMLENYDFIDFQIEINLKQKKMTNA